MYDVKRLARLQDRQAEIAKRMEAILETAGETTDLTAEQLTEFDKLEAEAKENTVRIEREHRVLEAIKTLEPGREVTQRLPDPANRGLEIDADAQIRVGEPPKFGSLGEQLIAIYQASSPGGRVDPRLRIGAAISGMSESVASDGGFLVQTDFAAEMLRRTYEMGAISSRVRRFPISANSNSLKINALAETSRITGCRLGGITGQWLGEGGGKTASQPEFRQIELNLKKLACKCVATDELLQDAVALESLLLQGFAEEISYLTEDSFVNGTGAGMPLGILNSACLVTVAAEPLQAANTIVFDNLTKMWAQLWGRSQQNAIWCINQSVYPELFNLSLTVGTGGAAAFMPPGGLSGSPYATIFGRPVIPVEYCAALGTIGDVILADWSEYLVIDKGGIQSASSIHVRFIYDETTFRSVYRVDGQPAWQVALTPAHGANLLSPFVVLATRP